MTSDWLTLRKQPQEEHKKWKKKKMLEFQGGHSMAKSSLMGGGEVYLKLSEVRQELGLSIWGTDYRVWQ